MAAEGATDHGPGVALGCPWVRIAVAASFAPLARRVIARAEARPAARFGEAYAACRHRARRWR